MFLTILLNINFFFVVSNIAYRVINTYNGFVNVVDIIVDRIVFKIIQLVDGPTRYRII